MKLAIKGHPTRGKEVIKLLEMLGGKQSVILPVKGNDSTKYYFIENGRIAHSPFTISIKNHSMVYTLEEFEELYPFKVGDKVHYTGTALSFNKDNICTITGLHWNHALNKIFYILDNQYQCSHKWIAPMKQKELKDYLKPGYVVEYACGNKHVLTQDIHGNVFGVEIGNSSCWTSLNGHFEYIVAVYQIDIPTNLHDVINRVNHLTKVWERKEVELTMQEIADKFGIDVNQLKIKK